ncbi:hypothetical protein EYZ11_010858 [Aspergillus tanneri]|uniref:Uncharacterized protein n=1 Tax=Aspergillus tanneri TaxID=1220188 RepID=A0A4S3J495_9EURO|nr:hypothetical protein EYZ11_010858 [Aspergillus tanneri]
MANLGWAPVGSEFNDIILVAIT